MFYPWLLTSLLLEVHPGRFMVFSQQVTPISSLESTSYNETRGRGSSAVVSVQPPVAIRRHKGEHPRSSPRRYPTGQSSASHATSHGRLTYWRGAHFLLLRPQRHNYYLGFIGRQMITCREATLLRLPSEGHFMCGQPCCTTSRFTQQVAGHKG